MVQFQIITKCVDLKILLQRGDMSASVIRTFKDLTNMRSMIARHVKKDCGREQDVFIILSDMIWKY